jgi:hypothetical protein
MTEKGPKQESVRGIALECACVVEAEKETALAK